MSDMIRHETDECPRRSMVRFDRSVHVIVMDDHSVMTDDYDDFDIIDLEDPKEPTSSMMDLDQAGEVHDKNDSEKANDDDADSSHNSDSTKSAQNHHDWMMFLYQSYATITLLMASGGAILSKIISCLCPSRAQINEDDLVAVTGLANGDKAFLFVGSDGGSSYISYVSNLYDCIIA